MEGYTNFTKVYAPDGFVGDTAGVHVGDMQGTNNGASFRNQDVVATDTGATTGTILNTVTHASVTSAGATKQVILPAPVVGRTLTIDVGANGFDLKSSAPATIAINGGKGATVKSAIAANSTCYLICVSATAWKGFFMDADGDVAKIAVAA